MTVVVDGAFANELGKHSTMPLNDSGKLASDSKQRLAYLLFSLGETTLFDDLKEHGFAGLVFEKVADGSFLKSEGCTKRLKLFIGFGVHSFC